MKKKWANEVSADYLEKVAVKEYAEKHFQKCDNIKVIVLGLVTVLFSVGKSRIKHHKIKGKVEFYDQKEQNYEYLLYDKSGYFHASFSGITYSFKADSGEEAYRKYSTLKQKQETFLNELEIVIRRREMLKTYRRHKILDRKVSRDDLRKQFIENWKAHKRFK